MSNPEAKEEKALEVPHPRPEIIRVLLIEDNPGDARLVKEMLVDAGANKFSVTHAGLLSEGLSLLREETHHVILLDLSLPDGHGLDTVRQVCTVAPHLPVLILTGLDDETIAIRAVQEGAEDYLVKGQMDGNLLARAIRYAIERKRAEEALRDSEERYRTILENVEDGYYETDLAGNLTAFNDSMCRIFKIPKEQLIGLNNRRYMDPENAKRVYHAFNEVYRTGDPYRAFDWEITRRDGDKACIEASISLRKDASGKPVGFRGILRDITERKRTEELLRQSEEKYRTIIENIQDGYLEVDLAGNFTFFNDTISRHLGYTAEELKGMNYRQYTDGETATRVSQYYGRLYRTGEPIKSVDFDAIRKDGTRRTFEISVSLDQGLAGETDRIPWYFS